MSARLFAVNFSGFAFGVLVCGALSDRMGRKSVLLLSMLLYAVGLALFGVARLFTITLLASGLIGAGTGAMETVASALASDIYPERRAFILNAIQVAFGVGASIGPALSSLALGHGVTWRTLYLALAILTAGVSLLFAVQPVPRIKSSEEAVNFGALVSILKQPMFALLCLALALYVGAETGFFSWMPTYFEKDLPGGAAWAGLVVTVFWIAMTAGRIATGFLLNRLPLLRLLLLLTIGGAVGAALALVWKSPIPVQCFVGLTGLCFSGIFGLIMAETGEHYSAIAGTAFGGVVGAGGVGAPSGRGRLECWQRKRQVGAARCCSSRS